MNEEDFGADTFALPQGFGGLNCNGNEENISSCPVCFGPIFYEYGEPRVQEGENFNEYEPPPPLLDDPDFIPGSACCEADNRLINNEIRDVAAISCVGKYSLQ